MSAPRLPAPGWLPDPSRTDLERYWDGHSWTSRTRDRVSKVERVPLAAQNPPRRQRRTGGRVGRTLGIGALTLVVAIAFMGWNGLLPEWFPMRDALTADAPAGPAVDYPVFGSDELVLYLARNLVAQEPSIDVTYWTSIRGYSSEQLFDAFMEAAVQNPYAFVAQSSHSVSLMKSVIEPVYIYDTAEAERRWEQSQAAVDAVLAATGARTAATDAEKLALLHDHIALAAEYNFDAAAAINAGETSGGAAAVAESQEAYGILVGGTAVCNGYAQAFQLLADAAGIESVMVTGEVSEGVTTGLHAWNLVRVDGEWLVVDVTWDDAAERGVVRDYFLLSPADPRLASRVADDLWVVNSRLGEFGG